MPELNHTRKSDAMSTEEWRNALKKKIYYKCSLIHEHFVFEQHYLSLTMSCFALCYADANTILQYCYLRPYLHGLLPSSLTEHEPGASKTAKSHWQDTEAAQGIHKPCSSASQYSAENRWQFRKRVPSKFLSVDFWATILVCIQLSLALWRTVRPEGTVSWDVELYARKGKMESLLRPITVQLHEA